MTFEIIIQANGRPYRMQVTQTLQNDVIEEYEVIGGTKIIVFRCNRPEWKQTGKRKRMKWQLASKNFPITGSRQAAAMLLLEIQDRLEWHLEPPPSFEQRRNK